MRRLGIVLAVAVAVAAAGLAWWKLRPAEKIEIKGTDKDLKPGEAFPHALWTNVLKTHSKDGFVDYKALRADHAGLDAYLGYVVKFSPESNPEAFPKREDRLAYAINAYNAFVVKGVIDHDPVESVLKIGLPYDFFKKIEFTFGGRVYTLEAWETKAREEFREPRVHFAFNCASKGCPRLPEEAFEPSRLEEQLAREAKKFVNEERNVKTEGGRVLLSSIFRWYRKDFIGDKGSDADLFAKLREFGRDGLAGEIRYVDYDWSINELKR